MADVLLEREGVREGPGEPALERPAGRRFVEIGEQGGVAVQAEGGVEPAEERDGDDEG